MSPDSLHSFVFASYVRGDSYGKVNGTTSAIKMWCRLNGIPPPATELTTLGMRAYRKHYRRSRPPVWFTPEHISALLSTYNALQMHQYVLLVCSFYTLVRPKEILFLRWYTVFLDKEYAWLPLSKTDQEGAGTYVRLLKPALDALLLLSNSVPHSPNDLIFPLNQISLNDWLDAKCIAANVPRYTWYALKHGGATHLAVCSWSLSQIQNHGRWKSPATARIYIHAPLIST